MTNPHIGSSFDDFLEEQGIREEVDAIAVRRVIAWQIKQAMEANHITKVEMARRMATSRSQVDRLLNEDAGTVTLDLIERGARAVGRRLRVELI
jgi:predicted XRE-type DNA-binding protein